VRSLLFLIALAPSALAATITLTRDGAPVAGEVCRFRAGDTSNPFKRWFASQEVVCDGVIPRGTWNVFGRTSDAISAVSVLVSGDDIVSLELAPAATVVPVLPQGRGGVIYVPRRKSGFAFDDKTARVNVPANEELWLFVVDKAKPVALFPIPAIEAGKERSVDARGDGPPAVVGWLQIPDEDRAAIVNASGIVAPGVRAGTRESDPLPSLRFLDGAMFRVRDVPVGDAELRIEGRGWLHERVGVKVEKVLTVVQQPLMVRVSGNLAVHWSSGDLIALNDSFGSCEPANESSFVEVVISKCPKERRGEPFDPKACTLIRQESFDPLPKMGLVTLDDIAPGTYRAELHFGKLPPVSEQATVAPMQSKEMFLSPIYLTAYGSVTRGGEPLGEKAELKFPGGPGFAPANSDEYHAVLLSLVGPDAQIKVAACDGSPRAVVLTDEPMRGRSRYDVDIPANKLTLTVTDTFTREPLGGSTVKYEVMSKIYRQRVVMEEKILTDGDGRMVMEGVPVREIHLTVSHPGYQKQELEAFTMPKRDEKEIDVQLVPLRGNNGKILSERAFENGVVVWYSAAGSETERADVDADGTFIYMNEHAPDETMAVVSRSHPLWVSHSPQVERHQAIKVRYPNAPVRNATVGLATANRRDSWYIGFVIGGVRVPPPVFAMHQAMRKEPFVARGDQQLQARDLLETGPIEVLLGPTTAEFSERGRPFDFFVLPKYANVPRERLAPDVTHVTFTP
jgi:hypothetical protein